MLNILKNVHFFISEPLLVLNFRGEPKWLKATITEGPSPVFYKSLVEARGGVMQIRSPRDRMISQTRIGQGRVTPSLLRMRL